MHLFNPVLSFLSLVFISYISHVINFDAQIVPAWPWGVLSEAVLFTFAISILNLLIIGNGNSLPTKIFIMCI